MTGGNQLQFFSDSSALPVPAAVGRLVYEPPGESAAADGATIAERFAQFHATNPQVFQLLVELARQQKRAGRQQWSTKAAFEVVRWMAFATTGRDYKLNNNYTSHYAREIMRRCPDLVGFFEVRQQRMESEHVGFDAANG